MTAVPLDALQLPSRALLELLGMEFLEACPRDAADTATTIRKHLKAEIGRWQADAVMSCHREACLRQNGKCSRFLMEIAGTTLRLGGRYNAPSKS